MSSLAEALGRVCPGRPIHGISAVLLPYTPAGAIDWDGFERLLTRTREAGLDVAVNMDTGFGDLLTEEERAAVLDHARRTLGPAAVFYAGAFGGNPGDLATYRRSLAAIEARGAIPVIVQCRAMHGLPAQEKAAFYRAICALTQRALGFELGQVFAPHGEIWDTETFLRLLEIPNLEGSKHSSLDRGRELDRLRMRDQSRPGFRIYTGNDLAIDMVQFGSDYLLGLSTMAPAEFARRDAAFAGGNVEFLALNDPLQYLGNVAFRAPVPAYKHAAAQFLHMAGILESDSIHPRAPRRPDSDRVLLFDCLKRLELAGDPERTYRERVAPYLHGSE